MMMSHQQIQISDDPEKFASHFIPLKARDRKGKTTFRCLSCSHEFTCSGRRRLIQHILGKDYFLGKDRNVSACPNPFFPLKKALMAKYANECGEISSPVSECGTPTSFFQTEDANMLQSPKKRDFAAFDSEMDFLLDELLIEDLPRENQPVSSPMSPQRPAEIPLPQPSNDLHQLNSAIFNFFSAYNIPLSAIDSPHFEDLYNSILHNEFSPGILLSSYSNPTPAYPPQYPTYQQQPPPPPLPSHNSFYY